MNYPIWELGISPGLLIAVVAVLHVFVSHFAIGGGIFITVTEYLAVSKKDMPLLMYLKLHSRFFALLTLVFGALTGVGIWFTIGLINPAATSALIHIFVWMWALEWVFFLIEIVSGIVYYTTWDRVSQATHFAVGAIYLLSSFMSLVFINGILTFMLTPGGWLQTRNVWDGFFNPTYTPSFLARISICAALAGIYAFITSSWIKEHATRLRLLRYASFWALAGIAAAIPSLAIYYQRLPLNVNEIYAGILPTSLSATQLLFLAGCILAALSLFPLFLPRYFKLPLAFLVAFVALLAFGSSEFIRESVRKPFALNEYMLGNSLLVSDYSLFNGNASLVAHSLWVKNRTASADEETGRDVFRIACRNCHTLGGGYKGLYNKLGGMDENFIAEVIARLDRLRGKMPPFPGDETERLALARFLATHTDRNAQLINGKQVFRKRCAICHTIDREYRGLYPKLKNYSKAMLLERFPTLGVTQTKMVPWSGSEKEAELLAEYIMSWYGGGNNQTKEGE